jgi:hypothetical protein
VRDPLALGENVTFIVQLAPAAALPQLFVCEKSPIDVMVIPVKPLVPVLVNVEDCAVLLEPTT